ncbi:MAG: adenylosuccinate synthetase [Candidatus Komeilibacteria bacterium]|nr:adenylosuccinate synthetase [Candidatus Komeilibacteria bacterium]
MIKEIRQWFGDLIVTLVGMQWGDESKGQTAYRLAQLLDLDFVVRYNGGPNAGHTVVTSQDLAGEGIVLKQLPTGILCPKAHSLLGPGMVIDPVTLVEEMDQVAFRGVVVDFSRLTIDLRTPVIWGLPKLLEMMLEQAAGPNCIGTTNRGIGPAYALADLRLQLIMADLLFEERLRAKMEQIVSIVQQVFRLEVSAEQLTEWQKQLLVAGEQLAGCIDDVGHEIGARLRKGQRGLAEAAQGTFLDRIYGTWPFVTSSHTVAQGAPVGLGVPSRSFDRVIGVAKAYTTRVGAGPLPGEDDGLFGSHVQGVGREVGSNTGRKRRCAPFDGLATAHAVKLNGADLLVLAKLDVLSGLEKIPAITGYRIAGSWTNVFPSDPADLPLIEEVRLEQHRGWTRDISQCRRFGELPPEAISYVERLEELAGVPIGFIGVGPGPDQQIIRLEAIERAG